MPQSPVTIESPGNINTPIQLLRHPTLDEYGVEVWVKRDDLIHPFISGNKWRKLKYIVQDMRLKQKDHLVTFGGPWSNHVLASACAGASFGFKTTAFIRGEVVKNPVLTMSKLFGMELIFTDRTSYRDPEALYMQFLKAKGWDGSKQYLLKQGGHHPLALNGCAEIVLDLPFEPDQIICACGTGTTLAGISSGIQMAISTSVLNKAPKLIGISVVGQTEKLEDAILALNAETQFEINYEYHFGGYAKTKPALLDFVTDFCSNTGILIEPVYTGKLFYGIFDQIRKGNIKRNEKVLAIHTGGLTGILGMHEKWS